MKNRFLNLFILIIGGVIIFNLATNVHRLWQKRGQVSEEEQVLEELKIQNKELRTQLEYVQSQEFIEKEAREKLGWAKEGEEVWVLPPISVNPPEEIEEELPIWKQWVELFSN